MTEIKTKNTLGITPVEIDLHIADLLPPDPTPTREDTMGYRINEQELKKFNDEAIRALLATIGITKSTCHVSSS